MSLFMAPRQRHHRGPSFLSATIALHAFALGFSGCECDTLAPEGYNGSDSASSTTSSTLTSTAATGDATSTTGSTTTSNAEPSSGSNSTTWASTTNIGTTSETTAWPASCGDGFLDPGEECDNGPANADNHECTKACTVNVCGDGLRRDGVEECDDGGESADCDADCTTAECGDGTTNQSASEACDDANDIAVDGCEINCQRTKITRVFGGNESTCVLIGDGFLKCWGANDRGQLGYGHTNTIGDDEPASAGDLVDVGGKVTRVAMGSSHVCAVLEGGLVRCWGHGNKGRLGGGNTGGNTCLDGQQKFSCSANPVCCIGDDEVPSKAPPVDLGAKAVDIIAGMSHTCALLETGSVRCWGDGYLGQLGISSTKIVGDDEKPYGSAALGGSAATIWGGPNHTCAILLGGGVRCWGYEGPKLGLADGICDSLGDDELPFVKPFLNVGGNPLSMSLGMEVTCALMDGGAVKCWGDGGLLGTENLLPLGCTPGDMPPNDLDLGVDAAEIASGGGQTCARLTDGTLRCWGSAYGGELGNGTDKGNVGDELDEVPPDPVMLGGTAVMVAAGLNHTCAVLEGERLKCWGYNQNGQLGYGHTMNIGDNPGEMPPLDVPIFP